MDIYLHQKNNEIGNLEKSTQHLLSVFHSSSKAGLHLFPELFLGGYPLQDICLQRPFVSRYIQCLNKLQEDVPKDTKQYVLFGGLEYKFNSQSEIAHIYNCIYKLDCKGLKSVYRKRLLPNYDIFDEKKYFSPGTTNSFINIGGKVFCLFVCEDMWHSSRHEADPVFSAIEESKSKKMRVDGVINLSASPFHIGKQATRVRRCFEISKLFDAPFFYVNQIGLNDEILFDGQSFIACNGEKVVQAESFVEEVLTHTLSTNPAQRTNCEIKTFNVENTWEALFQANIDKKTRKLRQLGQSDLKEIVMAQTFALNEYARKTGMNGFLVALSGGIDSALVLAMASLASKASGLPLEAIYMPSQYNSQMSYDLSNEMCHKIGIKLKVINLKFIHQTIKMTFEDGTGIELKGVADENIQSRLRGSLIFARSNQTGAMVLNTSNKSELSVGYSTLYGDSVGALSILGDLYKTEVYQLAGFINENFDNPIPTGIISRPPTAELRDGQKDEDNLPPYEVLDLILEGLLSYQFSIEDLTNLGLSKQDLESVINLYTKAEFKRYQFCPIVKLKSKSFGFGYRNPILKNLSMS